MKMSFLCLLGLAFSSLATSANEPVCKSVVPIENEKQAWCAVARELLMQSCASTYGFDRRAVDLGEFWLLESRDKNPDSSHACLISAVEVRKVSGEILY